MAVARAELVIAGDRLAGTQEPSLTPDPLENFASIFDGLDPARSEHAAVAIDFAPLNRVQDAAHVRAVDRAIRPASSSKKRSPKSNGLLDLAVREITAAADQHLASVGNGTTNQELARKRLLVAERFRLQILIRASSDDRRRAAQIVKEFEVAFAQFDGPAYLRVSGLNLGFAFLGSDLPPRRWWFDYRLRTGLFCPTRRNIVTARELAAFLKPPTKDCHAHNVFRRIGQVAPAPNDLPTYGTS